MVRFGILPTVLAAVCTALLCVALRAQTPVEEAQGNAFRGKPVPPAVPPAPFSIDAPYRQPAFSIEFRPAAQMTEQDRRLAANAESSIAEHAGYSGFELEQGGWNYQQVVCPALPNHLFLQYTRNQGAEDVTVFSASIPRNGDGRVRIIPILRRGYSLFSPAPINALTVSAFNHIRAEEPARESSDWLGNGLCYAALAGAHPQVVFPEDGSTRLKRTPAFSAAMETGIKGGEIIKFADAAAMPKAMEWTMTFTRKGKLLKATHSPAELIHETPLTQKSAVLRSFPVPQ